MVNVPGMIYPTQKGMIGSTPADSARMSTLNKAQSQANANRLMSGGIFSRRSRRNRRRSRRYHRGGVITVPTYQMLYEPQGGPGTDPNSQIQTNSQTSTQMAQNAKYDNHATIKGGKSKRRRTRRRHHRK